MSKDMVYLLFILYMYKCFTGNKPIILKRGFVSGFFEHYTNYSLLSGDYSFLNITISVIPTTKFFTEFMNKPIQSRFLSKVLM